MFVSLSYTRLLWIWGPWNTIRNVCLSWGQVGCALTTEIITITSAPKLPIRTRQRESLQSRLEHTVGSNDPATHEGNNSTWKYPWQGSVIWRTHVVCCFSHLWIQSTQCLPGVGNRLLTYLPHPGSCQAEADVWFPVGGGQGDQQWWDTCHRWSRAGWVGTPLGSSAAEPVLPHTY